MFHPFIPAPDEGIPTRVPGDLRGRRLSSLGRHVPFLPAFFYFMNAQLLLTCLKERLLFIPVEGWSSHSSCGHDKNHSIKTSESSFILHGLFFGMCLA
jgi:hypothetical protein